MVLAATCMLGAGSPRTGAELTQRYDPSDYLRTKDRLGLPPLAEHDAGHGVFLGWLTGVTCAAEVAPPPVATSGRACAAFDANCWAQLRQALTSDHRPHSTAPSGSDVAEQLFGLLRDNCRSTGNDNRSGFAPALEVSVAQPAAFDGALGKKRQVSASIGINGSF